MSTQTLPTPPRSPPLVEDASSICPVPPYTGLDTLHDRIDRAVNLTLPITHAPLTSHSEGTTFNFFVLKSGADSDPLEREAFSLCCDIVAAFFSAVRAGHDDVVSDFVSRGYVSPDVTNRQGETPLIAAVTARSLPMVSRLVALGATVNAFGTNPELVKLPEYTTTYSQRTPLQVAAQNGNLAIVRALMEDYGADDSLVAPDGELALRLAAKNSHRDVVTYLPARRGGARLRWQNAHQQELRIMRHAINRIYEFVEVLVWRMPRFFLYTLPKEAIWKKRHKIAAWCKRLPSRIKEGIIKMPDHISEAAKAATQLVKKLPRYAKKMLLGILRVLKALPGVIRSILIWVGHGLKTIGLSMLNIAAKLLSFIHTTLTALASFLSSITLHDAWRGLYILTEAICVDMPKSIWSFLKTVGPMTYKALADLLGIVGKCLWYLVAMIVWFIQYIPRKVTEIIAALGRLFQKAFQELMIYCNPKRVR